MLEAEVETSDDKKRKEKQFKHRTAKKKERKIYRYK
jgi:hypothetical protein